jgi:NAD(P)-dependent dehydrogenase (short-subunit alcohol dehydrogenase family)
VSTSRDGTAPDLSDVGEGDAVSTSRNWATPDLSDVVALVTGASRGVGRGVALAIADGGATVYVTGRSSRGEPTTEDLPGTIEDTAEEVSARGGVGIAVRCDHTCDEQIERLFERLAADHGRLDLLVNNAWSGYERGMDARFDAPFWEQPPWRWDLFAGSLRGQFTTSRHAARLMVARERGLIVTISFNDRGIYLGNAPYDVSKSGSDRLVLGMAHDLRKYGVHSVALYPGFVRTERVAAAWDLLGEGPAQVAHTPEYVGRGVAALYDDPERGAVSGQSVSVGDLADRYGFTDIDGRRPPAFRLEGRMTLATRMERLNRVVTRAAGE